ncbi:MAG: phosphatase PAP2 family protein [Candidatus Taylorbacteria bacterium]|nr:phosphatase PAP2 family protein [Candidatus Taylorbacteria bacterium]
MMSDINTSTFFLLNGLAGQSMLLDRLIVFLAVYLVYIIAAVFILGIIFWRASRSEKIKTAAIALISVAVSRGIFVEAIRFFYHHPRPFAALPGARQLFPETGYSFPSGHTAFFFALSAVVYHYHKKAGVTFFVLSAIMGLARIAAGVHYPFDIIGGALIGWLVGFGICALAKRFSVKDVQ